MFFANDNISTTKNGDEFEYIYKHNVPEKTAKVVTLLICFLEVTGLNLSGDKDYTR
jgi:hypothetical protein